MTMQIDGSNGWTFNDGSTQKTAYTPGMRNRIINGAMMIDQRNAGASVTPTNGQYTLDRWAAYNGGVSSKFSVQQNAGSVTPPTGFKNYLGITSLSAYTPGASERFLIQQGIEGLNVADLNWGTSNAQSITIGFWVRSSLTGTFGGGVQNDAGNRFYVFSYTINSANTWEYKTVTIAGDTTGTWLTTNGGGIYLYFAIAAGSTYQGTPGSWGTTWYVGPTGQTNIVGTNGATLYITGVQLEKGSTATPFEYRPYGQELALCQRYYQCVGGSFNGSVSYQYYAIGYGNLATNAYLLMPLQVTMRASPTLTAINPTNFYVYQAGSAIVATSVLADVSAPNMLGIVASVASGITVGQGVRLVQNAGNATQIQLNAEL